MAKRSIFKYLPLALAILVVLPVTLFADNSSQPKLAPYRVLIHTDAVTLNGFLHTALPASSRIAPISPIVVRGRIPGTGRFRGELKVRRNVDWPSYVIGKGGRKKLVDLKIALLRGNFSSSRSREMKLVTATIYTKKSGPALQLYFSAKARERSSITKYYLIEAPLSLDRENVSARISRVPDLVLHDRACSADLSQLPVVTTAPGMQTAQASYPVSAVTYRVVQISGEGDYAWYQGFGNNASTALAGISSIMNTAEAIYEEELSVTFSVVSTQVIASSGGDYDSNTSENLLDEFAVTNNSNNHLGSADVFHLFTGRDLEDNTIGLAYSAVINGGDYQQGVICNAPEFSYSLSQYVHSSINYITFAHELGHNFGAVHDESTETSIMAPIADPSHTSFSPFSRGEIGAHVAEFSSCLGTQDSSATPTPTPTRTPTTVPGATATPTPTGGASPTATPTPTSGGGGGGGGGGSAPGEDYHLPILVLQTSITSTGQLDALVTLDTSQGGILRDTCATYLRLSGTASFGTTKNVRIGDGVTDSQTLSFAFPFKAKRPAKGKYAPKIYLKALYSCTGIGSVSLSSAKTLNFSKVKGKSVTKGSLLNKLAKKITAEAQ